MSRGPQPPDLPLIFGECYAGDMAHAVILANGFPPSLETLSRALARATLFVCADGGANIARAYEVTPHAIIGDLDSVSTETLAHFLDVPIVRDEDTERTDTEKAVEWVLAQGTFDVVTLLGASAGRLDHVLGHLSLLRHYLDRARLVLEDDVERAWLARGTAAIEEPPGTVVSFFAVGAAAEGVTTDNLRYRLRDSWLEMGIQDSISNVVEAKPAAIRIARGELLVIVVTKT
jgi:thiamine pyrophosphokinase